MTLKTKLRVRFVLLAMLSLVLIQSVIVGVSVYNNHKDLVAKSDMLISQLNNNPRGASRYFSVKIPAGKDAVYVDEVQHVSITAELARSFAERAIDENRDKGFIDGYRYRIYRNDNGTKIYFLFRESGIEMFRAATKNMIIVSVIGLAVTGALLIPVSAWVVKALADNHRKQKQFITAAGHELKTPLTVIGTNVQLLESEIGQNDWLDGIQKQTAHLTKMTYDLVALSKAEEYDNPLVRERFSFTNALKDVAEPYEVIARQSGIRVEYIVQTDLEYYGSKTEVQQLIQILLDNACKYCPENGFIRVNAKHCFRGVCVSVTNSADDLNIDAPELLLQRFRRGENSAKKNGFGIGLSIAEAIAVRHNGHITVSTARKGEFCVEVVLH